MYCHRALKRTDIKNQKSERIENNKSLFSVSKRATVT